jgi:hypothetical protein
MAYSSTAVFINLIKNVSAKDGDDVITIRKNFDTNDFEIIYRDQNDGSPVVHHVSGLYRDRVIDYLYVLFKNQALDEEGYKSIQLTLPALPRLIVSGDNFKDLYYREHFLEAVGSGLDLLDNTEVVKKAPSVRRFSSINHLNTQGYETPVARRSVAPQHLFFDEE